MTMLPIHHFLSGHWFFHGQSLNKQKIHQNKWIIIFMVLYTTSSAVSLKNNCPVEFSDVMTSNAKAKWESRNNVENEVVISEPECFDDGNRLIIRICVNSSWYPSRIPKCQTVPENNESCPDYFHKFGDYCVYVTESQPWEKINSFSLSKQIKPPKLAFGEDKYIWLPIKRVVNYGPFEYLEVGDNYGNPIDVNVSNYKEFFSGDCISYNTETKTMQPENCSNSHRFVRYLHQNYPLYNCPHHCQPTSLSEYKCFCKSRDGICKSFAKIRNFSDKKSLEVVVGNETCRIDELAPNNLSSRGLFPYINAGTWKYGNYATNCAICETKPLEMEKTEMVLSFERKKRQLYLLVYTPLSIRHDKYREKFSIYCFTNSAKDQLKKKVKTEITYKYEVNNNTDVKPYWLYVFKLKLEKYMGEYWCEAFSQNISPLVKINSNRVIAYSRKKGNEYSLRIIIRNICKKYSCKLEKFYTKIINEKLKEEAFRDIFKDAELRIMEVFNFDIFEDFLDILLHVSTNNNLNVTIEYNLFSLKLKWINESHAVDILYFESSEFCLPETKQIKNFRLTWPLTQIGMVAVSEELCVKEDGTPATRLCEGNFLYGAKWSNNASGYCVENASVSYITNRLREILKTEVSVDSIEKIWKNITKDLTILDIYYLNQALNQIREETKSSLFAMDFINTLMYTNQTVLKRSQNVLNLTDLTLELVDDILSDSDFGSESVFLIQKHNLIVHITNPFLSNISGFFLYGEFNTSLTDFSLKNFNRFDDFKIVETQKLHLAVYVPELILDQIYNETNGNVSEIFIITMVFYNDSLFIDNNFESISYVISVSIPGYGSYLQSPIPVFFKSHSNKAQMCGFWDNGKRTSLKRGEWSVLGSNYLGKLNETTLHICSFIHLTHFALLVMRDRESIIVEGENITSVSLEESDEFILELITIIGGTLSITGIFGIFLTMIIFEKWRNRVGTKILINLSVAVLLETICIHLSEIQTMKQSETGCKIIGMILHYVILSKFCWMLIYAFLQYFRFVKVLGSVPNNLILKSVIFGWGVPLVIVFIVGLTTTQNYVSSSYEFCYPRGELLYFTVLLPICFIILTNLVLFCIIMYQVTYTKTSSCDNKKMFRLRLYLALLLFSALGLPWVFGILAELLFYSLMKIILFYIFCITATLQGFVLFLFYIILNKETRVFWIHYIGSKKQYFSFRYLLK